MIKIVAKMVIKKDKVGEFKQTAKELIEKSRAEAGNVFYTLNQSTEDPQTLLFLECWKDEEAVQIHNASEHFTTILPILGELCESSDPVELYTEL